MDMESHCSHPRPAVLAGGVCVGDGMRSYWSLLPHFTSALIAAAAFLSFFWGHKEDAIFLAIMSVSCELSLIGKKLEAKPSTYWMCGTSSPPSLCCWPC